MLHEIWTLPGAILLSSFLGSWHCAGMCGPFAALSGSRGRLWLYHLGRLVIYFALGALSGAFGHLVLTHSFRGIRLAGTVALAGILVTMGLQYLFLPGAIREGSFTGPFHKIYQRLSRWRWARSSFGLGLMAGLLPCMWLYTYVLAAAASQSAWAGGLLMFLFWLGGLPALSAVSLMVRPSLRKSNPAKQRIGGLVLVSAGIYALASHLLSSF